MSTSYRRPRRSRIYDANFNIGYNTYKPALDSIDRKYNTPRESSLPRPRLDFGIDTSADGSLADARHRASRAITEETVFDSRGFKVPRAGVPLSEIESSFDQDMDDSLARMRASNKMRQLDAELDYEMPTFARKAKAEIDEAIHGVKSHTSEATNFIKKRALKVSFSPHVEARQKVVSNTEDVAASDLTRWSKLDTSLDDSSSLAKQRAAQSKARLAELEDDMYQREERQIARERRAANLKKMIRDEFDMDAETKAIEF
ncbi:uncharacterized protein LOC134831827 isoform X2 [Culicoides brevitarsis]|uniref:uncharacterized protein LOC134831827 isoform X2 n=1 Tax=Culicoides brevitarsis TaxID=469753 RepID=UPI00307B1F71